MCGVSGLIEVHDIEMRLLAGLSGPALRIFLARPFIDERTLLKQAFVPAGMALRWCYEADGAVAMLMVVPMSQLGDPAPCG